VYFAIFISYFFRVPPASFSFSLSHLFLLKAIDKVLMASYEMLKVMVALALSPEFIKDLFTMIIQAYTLLFQKLYCDL